MAIQPVLEYLPCQGTYPCLRHFWLGLGQGKLQQSPWATTRNAELQAHPGPTEREFASFQDPMHIPWEEHCLGAGFWGPISHQLPSHNYWLALALLWGGSMRCHCPLFLCPVNFSLANALPLAWSVLSAPSSCHTPCSTCSSAQPGSTSPPPQTPGAVRHLRCGQCDQEPNF